MLSAIKTKITKFASLITSAALLLSLLSGMLSYTFIDQKPKEELNFKPETREALLRTFEPFETGVKAPLKRVIDNRHPLNVVNYYGNEPVSVLWSSIPENQKPFSLLLILLGHPLLPGGSLEYLEETADTCEAAGIPYAIQNINGEFHSEEKLPIAYLESRFAKQHKYFYGLNAAEMYNGVSWRGETESNNSQYIIDCINLAAKYGAYFIWTDTNMNYKSGMMLEWLENNEAFYSAFKNNSQNIVLMNKESYGDPSTYSVMQGLWLAGLVGNWGVSSDWWHWQVDGNKKSLFGEFDEYVDDEWDLILSYPENMYVQSMMLVMSCGGTCFLAEAPNFSTSAGGVPIAGFEYGISPLLNNIISGEISIPSREEVLYETTAAVLGKVNYPEFNYNLNESNLYPSTGRYRIIPLLPSNLRLAERAVFEDEGIVLVDKKRTQCRYDNLFPNTTQSNTYAMRTANQWFFINNVENSRSVKSAKIKPALSSALSFSISAAEHTSAVISEKNDRLSFYISNYRTDKSEMVKKVTPEYRAIRNWIEVCKAYMIIDDDGNPIGVDDSVKRTTVITVNGTLNGGEPQIIWNSNAAGGGPQNRPFAITKTWDSATQTLNITINHNGVVKFEVLLDESDKNTAEQKKMLVTSSLKKNNNSTKALMSLAESLVVKDKTNYNEYSYMKFSASLEKAKVIISEGTYSITEILKAECELKSAFNNLLDISKYTALLKNANNTDTAGEPQETKDQLSNAADALLRETLSNNVYVAGRSNALEYSKRYKNIKYNKAVKLLKLEEKYDELLKKTTEIKNLS